jgi:acyl dehydratase
VDPSFFIGIGIRAGIRSGISAEGNVNMVQRLVQMRPVRLGEVLTVRGRIERIREVPRGHTVDTTVTFEDASGAMVIDASRTSLRPDPDQGARRGAGERPPPVVPDPALVRVLGEHRLTPERVKRYSMEGNSIHYDEEAARRAGFRAPMIGGGMGVHFLAALLWSRGAPRALDLDIYFRRPIFWDDRFTSGVLGDDHDRPGWKGLCLLRDEGDAGLKVLTEASIRRVVA